MRRVGLTGGIAAGKSVVAARLADRGARVVDHDQLARAVVAPGSDGLRAVVDVFGADVLLPDGRLDRAALGRIVFSDEQARSRLDAVLHPRIRAAAADLEQSARAEGAAVVVHDIPLLVETGQAGDFDVVVVVDAPAGTRVRRLVETRGMTPAEAEARVAAQATDDDRRAAADVVLDGSGPVAVLQARVDELWEAWQRDAGSPGR